MSGSLDPNIVLRLMRHDLPEQTRQAAELLDSVDEPFEVADIVFVEVAHVLERYYGVSRPTIQTLLLEFARLDSVNCNASLLKQALPTYVNHPALSFEDCCLAAYAEIQKALPLYTFDRKLARQVNGVQYIC